MKLGDVKNFDLLEKCAENTAERNAMGQRFLALRGVRVKPDDLPGEQQSERRRVDQNAAAIAKMAFPVGICQLIANHPITCIVIRDSKKCLGQAHQNDPLLARQRVFTEKSVETTYVIATLARFNDQPPRPTENVCGFGITELYPVQ